MKSTLALFAAGATLLAGVATVQADGIKWNTDLTAAMKLAKRTHKPILVDFYADW